ncbi:MAG: hypothetical protein AB7V45_11375 [Candidatus Krumholzibacteriia bacterium]
MRLQWATINLYLQYQLEKRGLKSVRAVEAARWLDRAQILKDSKSRPGKPLRDLLRQGEILGQRQEPNNWWYIDRVHVPGSAMLTLV